MRPIFTIRASLVRGFAPGGTFSVTRNGAFPDMLGHVHLRSHRRAEHTMGMPATQPRRWTAADVRQLIDASPIHGPRYELIDGELLVSPAPGRPHQRAVTWLLFAIKQYADREQVGETLVSPADLELRPGTISQPDLFVVPEAQADGRTWADISDIILSVEVLSPSTARNDRGRKRIHYQAAGVSEYWLVDCDARLVERWRPADTNPELLTDQLLWNPDGAASPLTLALADLWAAAHA
jgi:Uma2 family endonuclease